MEELQVCKRMYQCCLETEQLLKKEKQKAVEDIWAIKTANSNEIEKLLEIQVHLNNLILDLYLKSTSITISFYLLVIMIPRNIKRMN
jgi:hypothetical protein